MRKRMSRLDGPAKASGKAKYGYDIHTPDLLLGALLTSPYAHARVRSIDTGAAEKMTGVMAVEVVSPAGTEIQWAGTEVVAVAATTEAIASDAIRAVKVDYEVLPHLVNEEDLSKTGSRSKPAGEIPSDRQAQGRRGLRYYGCPCHALHHGVARRSSPGA
jgi:xanthine dehydrogenase YagR molybdenum-binding subunit